jgi:hypothetical protein
MADTGDASVAIDTCAASREPVMLDAKLIAVWPCAHALPTQPCAADECTDRVEPQALQPLHSIQNFHTSVPCMRRGDDAERAFLSAMERRGWRPLQCTYADNYQRHVDFRLFKDGKVLRVDVKALRALRRNGALQNSLVFVEMHEGGWLRGGQADVIAVQVSPSAFVALDRTKLRDFALAEVDMSAPRVPWPEQCYRRLYRRAGKSHELISLVDLHRAMQASACAFID